MWNRFPRAFSVSLCALLVSSALVVFLPVASANVWKEETDTDFEVPEENFFNTEIVGTGTAAGVQLKKNVPNWVDKEPDSPPEAREGPASCYSPAVGKMIVFGGYSYSSGTYLSDTWEYDHSTNTWTEVSTPTSPPGREFAGMAYADYWGVCVLFGGYDGDVFLADTWEYDTVAQTWEETTPIVGPPAMWSLALSYYESVQRVVMFGQSVGGMGTWSYNPDTNVWLDQKPPSQPEERGGFAMAYHEGIGRIVLFGGSYLTTFYDDTWEYDFVADTWTQKFPSVSPSGRSGHAMTYRSWDDSVVLFGGVATAYLDDTWQYVYPGPTWSPVSSFFRPPARASHVLEDDSVNDYVLLFGGYDGSTMLNDTWALGMGYTPQGGYVSDTFYCGEGGVDCGDVDWWNVWWNQTPSDYPENTSFKIRLASSPVEFPVFWDFVGPNGTSGAEDYYWYVGQEIWSGHDNNTYMRYQATFISFDGRYTPFLDDIAITFKPMPANPKIVETYPKHIQLGVGAYEEIFVNFSKPMDTASVTWTITPYVYATPTWSDENKKLILNHTDPFQKCSFTTVQIDGTDTAGRPLVPGDVPNPWSFSIECPKPWITETYPGHMDTGVALYQDIIIDFSEEMNTSSLVYTVDPDPGGWSESWSIGNTRVTLSHTNPFKEWWRIWVEVKQAKSVFDQPLISGPVPNPWWFETTGYSPYIVSTDPADNETGVALNKAITIIFSEAMDIPTVSVTIAPDITLTQSWTGNTQLTLTHTTDFLPCQPYTVGVEGKGLDGNDLVPRYGYPPNPFTFMTTCTYPFITETRPYHGETGVDIMKKPLVIFSEWMNPATLVWSIYPNPGGWEIFWDPMDNLFVQFNHSIPFTYCTEYTMEIIDVKDGDGNSIVPGPVPNPWTFTTFSEYPCILNTTPHDAQTNVSVDADIWVNFSESIDLSSFSWEIAPDENLTWTDTWSNFNKTLRLSHQYNFSFNEMYIVSISARDLDGNDLVPGPVPNPWWFSTEICPGCPYIDYHYPAGSEENIPVDADILVNFSEPMDTGTVTWNFTHLFSGQPVGGVVDTWSNGDVTLTLSHDPLIECDWYQVEITGGTDKDGEPLQPNPDLFDPNSTNPWQFRTACTNPYIVSTYPADGAVGVPVDQPIIINFSEEMDTGTVTWTIIPDEGLGWSEVWSNGNTTLTLYHTLPFSECTIYQVEVTAGKDVRGLPLIPGPVPNPWSFTTICPNPYIIFTDPADGETGVPFDYPITIGFSEEMDTGTVTWTIIPDEGLGWSEVWSNGNTTLTLYHTLPFTECADYQVEVTGGLDLDGLPLVPGPDSVPNPWFFKTACIPPYITETDPYDGEMGVLVNYPITIWFSEPMNSAPGAFLFTSTPDPLGWGISWYDGDTRVVLTHNDFLRCTEYTIDVFYAEDKAGLALVPGPAPNPWSFFTECPNPYINWTDPRDGETNVELDRVIQVKFSDPMDTASVNWTINPDPSPGNWLEDWYDSDMLMVLTHPDNFTYDTQYTVQVVEGRDKDGYDLIDGPVPNPWQFMTGSPPPGPEVNWTKPYDGEMNVYIWRDVVISFTKEIVPGTFHWNITRGWDPGGWSESWSQEVYWNDTVTLSHSNPFNETMSYCFRIEHAKDVFGQDLPVPYDFCFFTGTELSPPGGLTVTKSPPFVRLMWNLVPGATHYNIYDSTDKWASFPSGWNMNQVPHPTNTYDFSHIGDGLTHYYVVRAYDGASGRESTNSTMGVKIEKSFTFYSAQSNIYWMSLPFISEYTKASDIANELTSTKIDVVGKWDRQKQKTEVYFFARGKWRGTDFAINAGDGIYVGVVRDFSWDIVGTDSDASIDLPFNPTPAKQNRHWISVPYTGIYTRASEIVADIEPGPGAPTKIIEVGKWDPVTQSVTRYYYDGVGWTGVDFTVEPGDGIYLKVIATFDWTPTLVTPYVG